MERKPTNPNDAPNQTAASTASYTRVGTALDSVPSIPCDIYETWSTRPSNHDVFHVFQNGDDTYNQSTNIEQQSVALASERNNELHSRAVDEIFQFINVGFESDDDITYSKFRTDSPNGTSTKQHSLLSRSSADLPDSVNFNSQEPVKDSSPIKEMDEFLPEEKTIDFSLASRSWKGRAPPTCIVDLEDTSYQLDPIRDARQHISRRDRPGSFEKLPGTGRHISNIQVKRDSSRNKKSTPGHDDDKKKIPLGATTNALAFKSRNVDVIPHVKEKRKDSRRHKRSTDKLQSKQENAQTKCKPVDKNSNRKQLPEKNNCASKVKKKNAFKPKAPNSLDTICISDGSNEQSSSVDPGMSVLHISQSPHSKKDRKQSHPSHSIMMPQTSPDNFKVYVNVNVNMNNTPYQHAQQYNPIGNNLNFVPFDSRETQLQNSDLSDSTDKTATTFSDDEMTHSDHESSGKSDFSFDRGNNEISPNNPSLITLDRLRMLSKLGPGGLSPIPSESYESDSSNRQIDSSCDDDIKTAYRIEYSESDSVSSDTTIKGFLSDHETDYGRHQKNDPSRPIHKQRKISFDKSTKNYGKSADGSTQFSTVKDNFRQPIARSNSQPEQHLLQKRQTAIDNMLLLLPESRDNKDIRNYHKRLGQTVSDPLYDDSKAIRTKSHFDSRLPLNIDFTTDADSRYFSSAAVRNEFNRSSYSSRVSRTSSFLSEGRSTGRRRRQLSVDIGEEWENIHPPLRPRALSDVGSISSAFSYISLRSLRKQRVTTKSLVSTDDMAPHNVPESVQTSSRSTENQKLFIPADVRVLDEIDAPRAEIKEDKQTGAKPIYDVPKSVSIEVTSPEDQFEVVGPQKRILLNNPYNSINQKFHSALHCPCFLFFCFLCCAPAVYWMQKSDYEFDYASEELAKRYGRRATALYVSGILVSILIFTAAIVVTYIVLQDEILRPSNN